MSKNISVSLTSIPKGFSTFVTNLRIKDDTDDFLCIISDVPCTTTGVFTQSRFAAPSVTVSRRNIQNGKVQAIIALSKNANVANGSAGLKDIEEIIKLVEAETGILSDDILVASTGIIGKRYPMSNIRKGLAGMRKKLVPADFNAAARAIMTTDTVPKIAVRKIGMATLVGIAKGVGMIEPNMATLLAFFFTDATLPSDMIEPVFRSTMDKTFNCLSIDTDTSTSDTALILANGLAGEVSKQEFAKALEEISHELVLMIAQDGEGATKVIEVTVDTASTYIQAKRVAKAIVNSPLVKTAVHGADPNWGRVAMAIGKCDDEMDIDAERVVIRFGEITVYPNNLSPEILDEVRSTMLSDKVCIHVSLNIGEASATVWGCDLSGGYVEINSKYST